MNFGGTIHLNKTGVVLLCGALLVFYIYVFHKDILKRNELSSSKNVNLKDLLKVAIRAAKNGGYEVVASRNHLKIKNKGLTKEGMNDSVTTADYLSHCSMTETLKFEYSNLNIISEEKDTKCDEIKNSFSQLENFDSDIDALPDHWENREDVTVWIDPLDATHEYTEKLYQYVTTMVCVAVKGQPIIGVIHKPFIKETSWAWVNYGKFIPNLDEAELKNKNEKLKIIISRSHSGKIQEILKNNFQNYDLVIAAGAGYKALEVATGKVDAYLHITAIKKWDICAGNAIINAVGGKMTTKHNQLIDYKHSINVQNEDGLVATLKNHELFIGKL